ncbi:hypothetical protein [uncultured Duncaniella sp.]|uniref:hypothetical protein n=1 Tax=uncultured Duncaniella sp. TaxID=2768039 RepID=UPI0026F40621|nr:hypothetical protein [uncultured Duncaniella sp.]
MTGFPEDLLNCMAQFIADNWEKKKGNISYFVNKVLTVPLTTADLDKYLQEQGDTCPECVNNVFAAIVYADFLEKCGDKESASGKDYVQARATE